MGTSQSKKTYDVKKEEDKIGLKETARKKKLEHQKVNLPGKTSTETRAPKVSDASTAATSVKLQNEQNEKSEDAREIKEPVTKLAAETIQQGEEGQKPDITNSKEAEPANYIKPINDGNEVLPINEEAAKSPEKDNSKGQQKLSVEIKPNEEQIDIKTKQPNREEEKVHLISKQEDIIVLSKNVEVNEEISEVKQAEPARKSNVIEEEIIAAVISAGRSQQESHDVKDTLPHPEVDDKLIEQPVSNQNDPTTNLDQNLKQPQEHICLEKVTIEKVDEKETDQSKLNLQENLAHAKESSKTADITNEILQENVEQVKENIKIEESVVVQNEKKESKDQIITADDTITQMSKEEVAEEVEEIKGSSEEQNSTVSEKFDTINENKVNVKAALSETNQTDEDKSKVCKDQESEKLTDDVLPQNVEKPEVNNKNLQVSSVKEELSLKSDNQQNQELPLNNKDLEAPPDEEQQKPNEQVNHVSEIQDHRKGHPNLLKIQDIEEEVKSVKVQVLHFSGTSSDIEYLTLHETLVKNMINLDDIKVENDDEVRSERKRVIKIAQQCLNNLESKVEVSKGDNDSDSE